MDPLKRYEAIRQHHWDDAEGVPAPSPTKHDVDRATVVGSVSIVALLGVFSTLGFLIGGIGVAVAVFFGFLGGAASMLFLTWLWPIEWEDM